MPVAEPVIVAEPATVADPVALSIPIVGDAVDSKIDVDSYAPEATQDMNSLNEQLKSFMGAAPLDQSMIAPTVDPILVADPAPMACGGNSCMVAPDMGMGDLNIDMGSES